MISNKIVNKLGGNITFESKEDVGSTFKFRVKI